MIQSYYDRHGSLIKEDDILEGANSVIYRVEFDGWELVGRVLRYFREDEGGQASRDWPNPAKLKIFDSRSISIIDKQLLTNYD